jgi:hypothetical protein
MRSVTIALAVALALMVVTIGGVLSRSPLTVAGTNAIAAEREVLVAPGGQTTSCEQAGTLPQGTSAIRVSLTANVGPMVRVSLLSGSRVLTRGERPAGWGLATHVVVPVRRVPHTVRNARICTTIGPRAQLIAALGTLVQPTAAEVIPLQDVRLRMEYLRRGPKSWWSLASSIAYHMGLGRAASGTWIVFLVLTLMIVVAILASRLTLRELR